jgi:hypothetical protein
MLSIGTGHAVVAADTIDATSRARVLGALQDSGHELVMLDATALAAFAGNVLEVRAADGARVLALSQVARDGLGLQRLARLQEHVDRFAVASIPTIETLGGGSVRCMLAEVFLPRN